MQEFYAHGKLLLTAEYTVLQGAKALAFPTRQGQRLRVETSDTMGLSWYSFDMHGHCWFKAHFDISFIPIESSDKKVAEFLTRLFNAAKDLGGRYLDHVHISTYLEFEQSWGFGSSSSLIALVARLFEVDPMQLFFSAARGSGYDAACATTDTPILYSLDPNCTDYAQKASWEAVTLPDVYEETYFVYLNQKQKSLPEVKRFMEKPVEKGLIKSINKLTNAFLSAEKREDLQQAIEAHEQITAKAIGLPPLKETLFPDYNGAVKSLGAWGGDFAMAIGEDTPAYFKNKGFHTIHSFRALML